MYADNGTILTVAIALGVALCVVYFHFKNRISKLEQEIDLHKKVINKVAEAVDQEFAEIRNEIHRGNADVLSTVADAIEEIEKSIPEK